MMVVVVLWHRREQNRRTRERELFNRQCGVITIDTTIHIANDVEDGGRGDDFTQDLNTFIDVVGGKVGVGGGVSLYGTWDEGIPLQHVKKRICIDFRSERKETNAAIDSTNLCEWKGLLVPFL